VIECQANAKVRNLFAFALKILVNLKSPVLHVMTSPENNDTAIKASLAEYNGRTMIRLEFKFDTSIITDVKAIRGRIWSAIYKRWYVPDTHENRQRFGLSDFDQLSNVAEDIAINRAQQEVCQSLLDKVIVKITLKSYSQQTLKSYISHLKKFLNVISKLKDPTTVTQNDIEQYLLDRQKRYSYSESDSNSHINAIKFLYEQVLGRERMLFYLPRPEKPLQLPKVLGEHELEKLFRAVPNLKHKSILLTAFSCGLRVSEVTQLRLQDIDRERMQVFIERSKGKKDRYVNLSPILVDVLDKFVALYKPTFYLFEGQEKGKPYSSRSAQVIFNRAVKDAGIHKKVTFHSLRHSYATHLLEKGVDIKYIKDLLGHFDIKTTERYLHVTKDKLIHIKSPLDYLDTEI
jgi:integrase/recombinase XerD